MNRASATLLLGAFSLAFLVGCSDSALEFLADKNSGAACVNQTSMDLDQGNFDAVIASECASNEQKGAAYFGRAGFVPTNVIQRLIEAKDEAKPIRVFLSGISQAVTASAFADLDAAAAEYSAVDPASDRYRDSQFYLCLVKSVRGLALMKMTLDIDGDGAISSCDNNGNAIPDELDAASCALLKSVGLECGTVGATYAETGDLLFSGEGLSGTYKGLTASIPGTASAACPADYRRLLYKSGSVFLPATTTAQVCVADAGGGNWPCPLEAGSGPLDFVANIDQSIADALAALDNANPLVADDNDLLDEIRSLKTEICGGDVCTAESVLNFLRTW